jgi:hypothetical protein
VGASARAEAVVYARKLETPPNREARAADAALSAEERPWSRRSRLLFMVAAGATCWAVPALIIYWLLS